MRSVFFYTFCIAFLGGVFVATRADVGGVTALFCAFIGVVHGILGYFLTKEKGQKTILLSISIFCIASALGMMRVHSEERVVSPFAPYRDLNVVVYGHIAREPDVRDTLTQIYVTPSDPNFNNEKVLVTVDRLRFADLGLKYGDQVRIEGKLTIPQSFETDTGRVFDYQGYLRARGVEYTIAYADVTFVAQGEHSLIRILHEGKAHFEQTLETLIPEPYAGLGEGMLLGLKRAIGTELEETFRNTGIIHIVVLSGYNIMIVVECISFILAFFFFPRTRMILGICGVWIFALLVGLSATVVRASLMATLLLIARNTGRAYAIMRALMIAALCMVLHNPYILVHDPGFQLSFLATLGLILLVPHIERVLNNIPTLFGIRSVLVATIAAQIFVLPLLLYHTGIFSIVSILVNVLVLPMVPFAMLFTFLTGVVGMLSTGIGLVVGFFAYLTLGYIITVAKIFDALPFAAVFVDTFPFWIVCGAYAGITLFLVHLNNRSREPVFEEIETTNAYEGWVIEEDTEISPESLRDSGEIKTPLPFR